MFYLFKLQSIQPYLFANYLHSLLKQTTFFITELYAMHVIMQMRQSSCNEFLSPEFRYIIPDGIV